MMMPLACTTTARCSHGFAHLLGQARRLGKQAGVAHRNRRRNPKITQRGRAPKATLDRDPLQQRGRNASAGVWHPPEPTPPRDTTIRSTPVEQPALHPRGARVR